MWLYMKKIFLIAINLLLILSAYAQTSEVGGNGSDTAPEDIFNKFYLEIGMGTQVLFSQDADMLETVERFTPHIALSVGKWISPFWGTRIKFQGVSLNGFTNIYSNSDESFFDDDPVRNYVTIWPNGNYRHFIRYSDLSIDIFTSLYNLVKHNRENYHFNVIPSVGVGWMHIFPYKGIPENNVMSYHFGLAASYRFNSRLILTLDGSGIFIPNNFEGRDVGSNKFDKIGTLDLTLAWNFK